MPPFVVVLGGAKISDKITMLRNVLNKAAMILVGGALANPFLKALGYQIGSSLVEGTFVDVAKGAKSDPVAVARELIENTKGQSALYELIPTTWPNNGRIAPQKLQLPLDVLIAKKNSYADYDDELLTVKKINSNLMLCGEEEAILDIGPHTIYLYTEIVKRARTIFWNGPMGFFEDFNFSNGTKELAEAVADSNGFSIIGGGDTEAVVTRFNLEGRFGHVSTGGGASLAVLAGEELPVMRYLKE
jgi:3-phosphoglycerate kinase